jgi:hypothetical protein
MPGARWVSGFSTWLYGKYIKISLEYAGVQAKLLLALRTARVIKKKSTAPAIGSGACAGPVEKQLAELSALCISLGYN